MRRAFTTCVTVAGILAGTPATAAHAATTTPAKPTVTNLLADASAEATTTYDNLWDGVDAGNILRVRGDSLPVLPEGGGTSLRPTPFPCSPAFVDINADGLRDLMVGSADGYLWVYLNSGSKGQPAFTTGTFVKSFIGFGGKMHPTDWDGDGDIDIVIGSFYGDVVVLENIGTPQQYAYVKKPGIPRYVDPRFQAPDSHRLVPLDLGKDMMTVGNYMTPWVADWNNDSKPDLLLGEGTYSANSVRLLLNAGTRRHPKFVKEKVFFLAWGEGREHLTPAVADFNGDTFEDMIMGTRKGTFRLHKGSSKARSAHDAVAATFLRNVPPPAILELDHEVTIKDVTAMSIAWPCDWNADGKWDLLVGGTDGRPRIALNTGTKEAPRYETSATITGTDTRKDRTRTPHWFIADRFTQWWPNWYVRHIFRAQNMCNTATMLTAETEMPGATGKPIKPVEGKRFLHFRYVDDYLGFVDGNIEGARTLCYEKSVPLVIDRRYTLSFSRFGGKGGMRWNFSGVETVKPGDSQNRPEYEHRFESQTFGATPNAWRKQEWTFKFDGKNKEQTVRCHFWLTLPKGDCTVSFDDFQLTEAAR